MSRTELERFELTRAKSNCVDLMLLHSFLDLASYLLRLVVRRSGGMVWGPLGTATFCSVADLNRVTSQGLLILGPGL